MSVMVMRDTNYRVSTVLINLPRFLVLVDIT